MTIIVPVFNKMINWNLKFLLRFCQGWDNDEGRYGEDRLEHGGDVQIPEYDSNSRSSYWLEDQFVNDNFSYELASFYIQIWKTRSFQKGVVHWVSRSKKIIFIKLFYRC